MSQYAGADWISAIHKGKHMSPLGVAAANLLGDVFQGIYHIDTRQLRQVNWHDPEYIEVPIETSLCTVDFDHLTRLIVLAHDRKLRVQISGRWKGWLKLTFHQRDKRTGDMSERCPTIEEHIASLRQHYGEPIP